MSIVVNGRFKIQRVTGVQRYAKEIVNKFSSLDLPFRIEEVVKPLKRNKIGQQLWEQFVLPLSLSNGDVLWSPANTGPISYSNQVITLHDLAVFPHPEWFSTRYAVWKRTLIPMIAKKSSGIITVSDFSKSIILDNISINPNKIKVIYNGVNDNLFSPANNDELREFRNRYDLHKRYILTLGSIDPRKNLEGILKAWAIFLEENPASEIELLIAGAPNKNFRNKLSLSDIPEKKVKYLGYVDDRDLSTLYSGAELFLYPSLFEGFGLPVLEAMICKTPVLTSNSGALKEISSNSAYLVNPHIPGEIAEGINDILNKKNLAEKLRLKGYQHAQKFKWEDSAIKTYKYLNSFDI